MASLGRRLAGPTWADASSISQQLAPSARGWLLSTRPVHQREPFAIRSTRVRTHIGRQFPRIHGRRLPRRSGFALRHPQRMGFITHRNLCSLDIQLSPTRRSHPMAELRERGALASLCHQRFETTIETTGTRFDAGHSHDCIATEAAGEQYVTYTGLDQVLAAMQLTH